MRALSRLSGSGRAAICAGLALAALGAAALLPQAAAADTVLCSAGTGAGQCSSPKGVAIDASEGEASSGRLYVADSANNRVDVFDAASEAFLFAFGWGVADASEELQTCTAICLAGLPGSGAGQFNGLAGIAVDNDEASPSFHDVYVLGGGRVQRFHPSGEFVPLASAIEGFASEPKLGTGPGGSVYVADNIGGGDLRVRVFDYEGNPVKTCSPLPPGEFGQHLQGFAVESAGGFYLASGGGRPIRKYDSSCAELEHFHESSNIGPLATDPGDDLFVSDILGAVKTEFGSSPIKAIAEYDAAEPPAEQRVVYGMESLGANGIARFAESLYLSESGRVLNVPFPPPGPVAIPKTTRSKEVRSTKATLYGQLNPEGHESTYHFDYVDQESFEASGFAAAQSTAETPLAACEDDPECKARAGEELFRPYEAGPVQIEGLAPETTYHFRLVATEVGGPEHVTLGPEGAPFTTQKPIEFEAVWSTGVGTEDATLHVQANPLGSAASGYFEYVSEADYEASGNSFAGAAQSASFDFGAGEEAVSQERRGHGPRSRHRLPLPDRRPRPLQTRPRSRLRIHRRSARGRSRPAHLRLPGLPAAPAPTTPSAAAPPRPCPTAAPMRWSPRSRKATTTSPR